EIMPEGYGTVSGAETRLGDQDTARRRGGVSEGLGASRESGRGRQQDREGLGPVRRGRPGQRGGRPGQRRGGGGGGGGGGRGGAGSAPAARAETAEPAVEETVATPVAEPAVEQATPADAGAEAAPNEGSAPPKSTRRRKT